MYNISKTLVNEKCETLWLIIGVTGVQHLELNVHSSLIITNQY